jgi:hypothetical protein
MAAHTKSPAPLICEHRVQRISEAEEHSEVQDLETRVRADCVQYYVKLG